MGLDDDGDCVEHAWYLTEVGQRGSTLDQAFACQWCPAVRYEPAPDPRKRPRL